MKSKFAKIMLVVALVMIAPVGILLTGCFDKTQSLTMTATNRSKLYMGEEIDNIGWTAKYYNGNVSVYINITDDMVTNFSTEALTDGKVCTITYGGLTATQTYSVKTTAFNVSTVYASGTDDGDRSYLKFDETGSSAYLIIYNTSDVTKQVTLDSEYWDDQDLTIHVSFASFEFDANGKWTATGKVIENVGGGWIEETITLAQVGQSKVVATMIGVVHVTGEPATSTSTLTTAYFAL